MKRSTKSKNNLVINLSLLCLISVAIGYAVLTEQLTINNTVSYDAMKWNVGFTSAEDYIVEYEKIYDSNPTLKESASFLPINITLSDDKKTITYSCDLGKNTKISICVFTATITNDSTFDVQIESIEKSSTDLEKYNAFYEKYISVDAVEWLNDEEYSGDVMVGNIIKAGESKQIISGIITHEMTEDRLPESGVSVSGTLTINWVEVDSEEE